MKYSTYIALLFSILPNACGIIADERSSCGDTSIVNIGDKAPAFFVESIDGDIDKTVQEYRSL